jgi:hypothetical protein
VSTPNTALEPTRGGALGLTRAFGFCLCCWAAWLSLGALGLFAHREQMANHLSSRCIAPDSDGVRHLQRTRSSRCVHQRSISCSGTRPHHLHQFGAFGSDRSGFPGEAIQPAWRTDSSCFGSVWRRANTLWRRSCVQSSCAHERFRRRTSDSTATGGHARHIPCAGLSERFTVSMSARDRRPNTALEPTRMSALGLSRVCGSSCVFGPRGSAFER